MSAQTTLSISPAMRLKTVVWIFVALAAAGCASVQDNASTRSWNERAHQEDNAQQSGWSPQADATFIPR